ncbi:MAG: gamma-glutamyltransferase, partial [Alphaproteobacteria bacterium]|nr:gamma-glutamyltransferase [Alphaproteobacteria bacterium]
MPERQRTGRNISRLLAVLMGLGVAACEPGAPTVSPHYTRAAPFIGMIAADEPRAALVGEDILRA